MNNQNVKEILAKVNTSEIKSILIRTIGLIDVFGKMIIDITYKDKTKQSIEIISPVPVNIITEWLETNKLLGKTIMYKF